MNPKTKRFTKKLDSITAINLTTLEETLVHGGRNPVQYVVTDPDPDPGNTEGDPDSYGDGLG